MIDWLKKTPVEVWDGRLFCAVLIGLTLWWHYLFPEIVGTAGILADAAKLSFLAFGAITLIGSLFPGKSAAATVPNSKKSKEAACKKCGKKGRLSYQGLCDECQHMLWEENHERNQRLMKEEKAKFSEILASLPLATLKRAGVKIDKNQFSVIPDFSFSRVTSQSPVAPASDPLTL